MFFAGDITNTGSPCEYEKFCSFPKIETTSFSIDAGNNHDTYDAFGSEDNNIEKINDYYTLANMQLPDYDIRNFSNKDLLNPQNNFKIIREITGEKGFDLPYIVAEFLDVNPFGKYRITLLQMSPAKGHASPFLMFE